MSYKLLKTASLTVIISVLSSFLNYLVNFIVSRYLSVIDYGIYSTSISYINIFSIPIVTLSSMIIKKLGTFDKNKRVSIGLNILNFIGNSFLQQIEVFVVFLILLGLLFLFKVDFISILFIALFLFISLFFNIYLSILNTIDKMHIASTFTNINNLLKFFIIFIFLYFLKLKNLYVIYIAYIFSISLVFFILKHYVSKLKQLNVNTKFKNFTSYLKAHSFFIPFLVNLSLIGFINFDIIIAKIKLSDKELGLYSAMSVLSKLIFYFSGPINSVIFPIFTDKQKKHLHKKIFFLVNIIIFLTGIFIFTIYKTFPIFVINFFFNSQYMDIKNIIYLCAIFGTLVSITMINLQLLVAYSSKKAYLNIFFVILQILLIFLYGNNLKSIMFINIFVSTLSSIFFTKTAYENIRK